jgi:glycosyltransferase involved in cell wall biosynthesis
MSSFKVFLSVVIVVRNHSKSCEKTISNLHSFVSSLVTDYEIIIIDNGSDDDTISALKRLVIKKNVSNLQVFALTKRVDLDVASWAGIENALGDVIAVIDPLVDNVELLSEMLNKAVSGFDVVFSKNLIVTPQKFLYRFSLVIFNSIYKFASQIDLPNEAPSYRLISRAVVNFISQHPRPFVAYRHLPITAGFNRSIINYSSPHNTSNTRGLREGYDRGMRLIFSTTQIPMRLVTFLSIFGATINLIYALYVVLIGFFQTNVSPGWVSLSLQQSGMFFLISIVLFVLGEYILQMVALSNEGPPYHIAQEFNSVLMTRYEKLNIEEMRSKL